VTSVICDALRVDYKGFVLGPLDLTFSPGITCLVGANGAGKSTFFRVAAGVERPTSGRIVLSGESPAVGLLPQDVVVPPYATATQYLTYAAWLAGVGRRSRAAAVAAALGDVGLTEHARKPAGKLSGGMRRRLGLAQAVVHSPDVLLLDEPTVGLDPVQRSRMRDLIRSHSAGRATILATHLLEDVRALADAVVVLSAGQVVFDGTVAELEARAPQSGIGESALERSVTSLIDTDEAVA
jgi:ABC-2 type transport system ATP-binding protein